MSDLPKQFSDISKKSPPVRFTTWEEWNDCLAKMNAGLVVCPDCGNWVSNIHKIPEMYRNLTYRRSLNWWNSNPDVGAGREAALEFIEREKENTEYYCEFCMSRRVSEEREISLEERYDKCQSCGEWVEKGSVRPHRKHRTGMIRDFYPRCIEIDNAEYEKR